MNNQNHKHHIFLAYHGDDKTGSQKEAENVYLILKNIYHDDIDIYFHPISAPNASYHDTPREVLSSHFLILVAKNNIPVDDLGMIRKWNKNGELSDLYQEIDVFYEGVFKKNALDNKTLAKVIRVGELSEKNAEDFYYNMFKSENYKYEEIIKDFRSSLFFKNWFSKTWFYNGLEVQDNEEKIKEIKSSIKNKNIHYFEDGMYENEYLLSHGYTVDEISERHVYLDNLTVDNEKYNEALSEEVEGDAETWEDMIPATADCTANLIINNEIVGYMDFIPVEPETYDDLKTIPFTKDAVAFYSYGGDYDIFGSMFSIDLNYATPTNYFLFFKWMVEKIINWREKDIFIHRIMFSIYSNHQAKALGQLGFVKILENQLKGMLLEVTVEDLLNNKIVRSKILNINDEYNFKTYKDAPRDIISQCLDIANSHSVPNGGLLQFIDAVEDVDVIITAEKNNEVIGYVALKEYDIFVDTLYIEQIAIKKGYLGKKIGKKLIKCALEYARKQNVKSVIANCKKNNNASYNLFMSSGFEVYDMEIDQYIAIGFKVDEIDNHYALKIDLK